MKSTKTNSAPKTAMYIHGLASGAYSQTFRELSHRLPQYVWGMSEFSEDLAANVAKIEKFAAQIQPSLIVASSMGALALLYAKVPAHTVKIVHNPALSLADCVRNVIGLGKHEYLCRRLDERKEFELTEQMCCDYEAFIASHDIELSCENYAIFSAHDEVLSDEAAARAREIVAAAGYKVYNSPENQHRLSTATLEIIKLMIAK